MQGAILRDARLVQFERNINLLGGLGRVDNSQRRQFPAGGKCGHGIQRECAGWRG